MTARNSLQQKNGKIWTHIHFFFENVGFYVLAILTTQQPENGKVKLS